MATRQTQDKTAPRDKTTNPSIPLWTKYDVTWTFLTNLCASVPGNPELVNKWLETREPRVKPAGALSIEEIKK